MATTYSLTSSIYIAIAKTVSTIARIKTILATLSLVPKTIGRGPIIKTPPASTPRSSLRDSLKESMSISNTPIAMSTMDTMSINKLATIKSLTKTTSKDSVENRVITLY
jgi:hypothetical protein